MRIINPKEGVQTVSVSELQTHPHNPRRGDLSSLGESIDVNGFYGAIVAQKSTGHILAGNHRYLAAKQKNAAFLPVIWLDVDDDQAKKILLADNRTSDLAVYDEEELSALLQSLESLDGTGYTEDDLDALMGDDEDDTEQANASLSDTFLAPPFSVLDTKQGYWRRRKEFWLSIGIRSEVGRGPTKSTIASHLYPAIESSIFDPVLCEIVYTWFSPRGARVLDPFAGGSVRGVVCSLVGRKYTGVDLRCEQVEANQDQWPGIRKSFFSGQRGAGRSLEDREAKKITDIEALTPVETVDFKDFQVWVKREDLFCIEEGWGSKVRITHEELKGEKGSVAVCSRQSPQGNRVAQVAKFLGIPCRIHTATGELDGAMLEAQGAGAEIVQHSPGYLSVLKKRASSDARSRKYKLIKFAAECKANIDLTRKQVENIPSDVKRIVVPVGSGMTLAGVLQGLCDIGRYGELEVLGVQVGGDPVPFLKKYAPKDWRTKGRVALEKSSLEYSQKAEKTILQDIVLDDIYEAKCLPFLKKGDCLWIVGVSQTQVERESFSREEKEDPVWIVGDSVELESLTSGAFDLMFTCPPYADLEVYSDDPKDISNMSYPDFLVAYRKIIASSYSLLEDDSFAVIVVGEVRGKDGAYYNLVGDTVSSFVDAGFTYYNEIVLSVMIGTLCLRAPMMFKATRKVGKLHQNVLVFVKGCPKKAAKKCGEVKVMEVFDQEEQNS